MQDRIREAGRRAFSEEEFKTRLKERGVELRIRGEKYSYSMTDRGGKHRASREGRLGETYQRAHLVEKFGQQKEQLRMDPEGYRRRLKEEQARPYSWQRDLRGRIIEALRAAKNHEAFRGALEGKGVAAKLGEDGLYRFSFKDQHGLSHRTWPPTASIVARPTASAAGSRRTRSGPWAPAWRRRRDGKRAAL